MGRRAKPGAVMDFRLRPYLAELLGTFVLVFVGAGTVCASYKSESGQPWIGVAGIALAEGCALAAALTFTTLDGPGGCLNPAFTLMLWVCKRLEAGRAVAYVAAQLAGATLAGLAVRQIFSDSVLTSARLGTPHLKAFLDPDGGVPVSGLFVGVGLEAAFTAIVAFAVFATLIDPRRPRQGGLGVGIAQIAVVACGYNLTGGCANPARWFGPAVWQATIPALNMAPPGPFADHTIYWVGPVVGALLGGVLYSSVILPPER
jgi:glycerol uptake facilitator-like aquaporin